MLLGDARDSPPSCPTHAGETRIFIYENARLSGSGRNIAKNRRFRLLNCRFSDIIEL